MNLRRISNFRSAGCADDAFSLYRVGLHDSRRFGRVERLGLYLCGVLPKVADEARAPIAVQDSETIVSAGLILYRLECTLISGSI